MQPKTIKSRFNNVNRSPVIAPPANESFYWREPGNRRDGITTVPRSTVFAPPRPQFLTPRVPGLRISAGTGTGADGFTIQVPKKLVLDLSTARNTPTQFSISGTILWMYRAFNQADGSPNTGAFISIQIADLSADPLVWYAGNGLEGLPFRSIWITNTAQAGISVELAYLTDSVEKPVRFF